MFQQAIDSLIKIFNENAYSNLVVNHTIERSRFTDEEKKLYTKIVYGVVENKIWIDYMLQPLIQGKRVKPFLKNALRIGVYGMDFLQIQDYFLVNALVEEVKKRDYKGSTFLNAILRTYQSTPRRKVLITDRIEYLSIKYSINQDLVRLLLEQYPLEIEHILEAKKHNQNTYFINTMKIDVETLREELNKWNVDYHISKHMILETQSPLLHSPLFKEGFFIPQDTSSIEVGLVLNPKKGSIILDCCSAPGSKAVQLAIMMENTGKIFAGDIYEHKMKLIHDASNRLGLTCIQATLADATSFDYQQSFDYILADVPCSGLGVIHHKPDLKYQMTLNKIENIKHLQKEIVEHIIQFLKPGGTLVYSTCTINKEENEYFIKKFLSEHPNFSIVKEVKYLPTEKQDGFYICKLKEINHA